MKPKYFKREIDDLLLQWKEKRVRKPLLLRGIRRVGKSTAVRHFAKSFDYFIEVKPSSDAYYVFWLFMDTEERLSYLSQKTNIPVLPSKTLIFVDVDYISDIMENVLDFVIAYPDIHVVFAESDIFSLKKMTSVFVNKLDTLFMFPLSFDEFLCATGNTQLVRIKKKASPEKPLSLSTHQKLTDLFQAYILVGGMPESAIAWKETGEYTGYPRTQQEIDHIFYPTYCLPPQDELQLAKTLCSVIWQVGRKFQYKTIFSKFTSIERVKRDLKTMEMDGCIFPVHSIPKERHPQYSGNKPYTKYIFIDSGLVRFVVQHAHCYAPLPYHCSGKRSIYGYSFHTLMEDVIKDEQLLEMVVGLELLKYGQPQRQDALFYWHGPVQDDADYVIERDGKPLPIKIKSVLPRDFQGIRVGLENFGTNGGVNTVPAYALSNLFQ